MPYFICQDCEMSYEVDNDEDPSLYICSQCDGPLIYVEKLAEYGDARETSEITKIGSSTFTEKMVTRYNFIMYIAALIFYLVPWPFILVTTCLFYPWWPFLV
ncbi:hypothetical protein [Methanobacterium movens]